MNLDEVEICADLDRHVYFSRHTDPRVVDALRGSHWFDLTEWTVSGPGRGGLAAPAAPAEDGDAVPPLGLAAAPRRRSRRAARACGWAAR